VKLNRIGGRNNIILFYTVGCEVCAAEKEAALNLLKEDRKTRVLMVNVDTIMENDSALSSRLMDSFDLSSLPFIMITDSKGVVQRRYVSLQF
jgi:alkyl hydroperoxide reductase subunit AhpC